MLLIFPSLLSSVWPFVWLLGAILSTVLRGSSVSIVHSPLGLSSVSCLLSFLFTFCFGSGGDPLLLVPWFRFCLDSGIRARVFYSFFVLFLLVLSVLRPPSR